MFRFKHENSAGSSGLAPDPRLRELLELTEMKDEFMPFSKVQQLVASAPPARLTFSERFMLWLDRSLSAAPRGMRTAGAMASLLVVMAVGVMAATPAHSDFVGTIVTCKLPAMWNTDGAEISEVRSYANEYFKGMGIAQSDLYTMVMPREGRDDIAFTMLGVDEAAARGFYSELSGKYPALAAFDESYNSVEHNQYPNLLYQVVGGVTNRTDASLSDSELRMEILRSLGDQGFRDIDIELVRAEDGTVRVRVEATMDLEVEWRSQEELEASGISKLIGEEAYSELKSEIGHR